ncbi:flagellar basal body-associated protein FliL [Actibacterium mucosum KCTC 23349]|uniref:Flagellar protein FliL n=1 Tax=Actibacterium mucosum KCTC 23349 TaxID=1454373 RepID=A0A037ZLM8_9RHOB|nr:flagellar basal body-associated FliL family protein [Actibacterium mucosum]KAJ57341.1 flagellar basal body-associated protein FliL [Actibacterium mucosum KCTC 23349]
MGKIIPIVLALLGLGGGVATGKLLKPEPDPTEIAADETKESKPAKEAPADVEFVKLNNQFVVPVVDGSRVSALVVMSVSLEVGSGQRENVYLVEPKLRDAFLQVLFDHANAGGFNGNFTDTAPMNTLRSALREVAAKVVGPDAHDVLIVDIVRQDSAS